MAERQRATDSCFVRGVRDRNLNAGRYGDGRAPDHRSLRPVIVKNLSAQYGDFDSFRPAHRDDRPGFSTRPHKPPAALAQWRLAAHPVVRSHLVSLLADAGVRGCAVAGCSSSDSQSD